jgi:hypothetical protein
MQHSEDLEPLAVIVEADAVVTQAEAQFRWVYIRQALDITAAGEDVIGQAFEQTQSDLAIDPLHVGARGRRPLNPFPHPDQPGRR